jgi:outer membrane PBP1 activator LpoA protein
LQCACRSWPWETDRELEVAKACGLTLQAYLKHKRALRDRREKWEAQKAGMTDYAEKNPNR